MTKEQLEKANFISYRLKELNRFFNVEKQYHIVEIRAKYGDFSGNYEIATIEEKHQQELLGLLKKWRDEYQKELEEL